MERDLVFDRNLFQASNWDIAAPGSAAFQLRLKHYWSPAYCQGSPESDLASAADGCYLGRSGKIRLAELTVASRNAAHTDQQGNNRQGDLLAVSNCSAKNPDTRHPSSVAIY